MVLGDVNIWIEDVASSAASKLLDILSGFQMQQVVSSSNDKKGHTLDIGALKIYNIIFYSQRSSS